MEHVGQFRILGKIGEGGMGEVYRARDEKLHREVAIKIVPETQFSDTTAKARLLREARSAAGLSHPNICVVHEVGEDDGKAFIAMECVEGETLSARLARAPLSLPEAIRYGIQLADALSHAHDRGVIHRDLKPHNVIITPDQRLKVLDFGLARRIATQGSNPGESTDILVTAKGVVYGTPAYMAPEQLRGVAADERSDIWSLGVLLHEMVSRKRPFDGNTSPELSAAILTSSPRPLAGDVPVELKGVINRCLEKEPGSRYQHAHEVRSALEVIQTGVISARTDPGLVVHKPHAIAAAIALVVVIAAIAAVALSLGRSRARQDVAFATGVTKPAAPAEVPIRSMAVLPFTHAAGSEDEYLAEGIQDAVIVELAKIEPLRVLSRTSVASFRNTDKSATEIGKALNAEQLVEGSVQQVGDRVRVQLKLIRTAPVETQIWAEVYERDVSDVFALYRDIASAVATQVDSRLAPAAASTAQTARKVDPEIYKLYLKGMFHVKKDTPEGFATGMKLLREANDKDPTDPLPWAGLALGYAISAHSPAGNSPDALAFGRAAARKAIELDPESHEGHAAMALFKQYSDWDWSGLETDFKAALKSNPTDAEMHRHYGWYLILFQREDEAVAEAKRARDLEPLTPMYYSELAQVLMILGRYDEAIAEARKGHSLNPGDPYVSWPLGELLVRKGMTSEGVEMHRRMAKNLPMFEWALGVSLAAAGKSAEARQIAEKLSKTPEGINPFGLALIYAELGEREAALRWLDHCYKHHVVWTPWVVRTRSWADFRTDPRVADLYSKLKLPPVQPDFGIPRAK